MRPGQVHFVDNKEDINFMEYTPTSQYNALNNMLGGLAGIGSAAGFGQSFGNAEAQQQAQWANYQPYTEEELAERQKRREEEEDRLVEEQKKKDELRALNRSKMMQCFGGSIICLAFAVLFFSMNMSFHNTDYNTSLISSIMWFLDVVFMGSAVGLGFLCRYYLK